MHQLSGARLTQNPRMLESAERPGLSDAFAVYVAWVVATYLLEGLPGTLVRPDAVGLRLAYALVANLAIGIVVPLWLIGKRITRGWGTATDYGFRGARATTVGTLGAALVGYGVFRLGQTEAVPPVAILNAFAQVWVVSVAEIIVCWALVGGAVFIALRRWSRPSAYLAAATVASVLFGVYHFAHSPPFDDPKMVFFLTGIGFVTSVWWFATRDVFGTAIFHNFFGVTGVLAALRAGGLIPERQEIGWPLLMTAAVVTAVLVLAAMKWVRNETFT
jgi:hypothetical protein